MSVYVFLGLPGVGKTTTIAKLAAKYGPYSTSEPHRIHLITIDTYHILAKERMDLYASLLNIPCSIAKNKKELRACIDKNSKNADCFFIDTPGRSPYDADGLHEIKETLALCPEAECHLLLEAYTNIADEIVAKYAMFGYKSLIITKVDNLGAQWDKAAYSSGYKGIAVSFITTGQSIPNDIEAFNPAAFWGNKV
jgi:flagellar biosynthesis protein FlhF